MTPYLLVLPLSILAIILQTRATFRDIERLERHPTAQAYLADVRAQWPGVDPRRPFRQIRRWVTGATLLSVIATLGALGLDPYPNRAAAAVALTLLVNLLVAARIARAARAHRIHWDLIRIAGEK